ncbi:hypothetical protein CB1_001597001 [Camelus ferus]|nr:hypothetical protein CB1_001597001 [Camelus ferus]
MQVSWPTFPEPHVVTSCGGLEWGRKPWASAGDGHCAESPIQMEEGVMVPSPPRLYGFSLRIAQRTQATKANKEVRFGMEQRWGSSATFPEPTFGTPTRGEVGSCTAAERLLPGKSGWQPTFLAEMQHLTTVLGKGAIHPPDSSECSI